MSGRLVQDLNVRTAVWREFLKAFPGEGNGEGIPPPTHSGGRASPPSGFCVRSIRQSREERSNHIIEKK